MASPYRELLLDIARQIKPEELEEMKFLCVDFLPGIERESVLNFFCALEHEKRLAEDNLKWLEYLLRKTKRSDLVTKLKDFQSTKPEQSKTATALLPPEAHLPTESETNNDQRQTLSCEDVEDKDKESTKTKEERKREKRRKYKEKKKAAQNTSKEKDDPSPSRESSVSVEQDIPVKKQEETEMTNQEKQELSRNKDKGERIPEVKKKENSKTTGKEIQAPVKQKKAVEREKQILESRSQQEHQQTDDEHRNIPIDKPKVVEEKNQMSDCIKDDKERSEEPDEEQEKAGKCALDEPRVAAKIEEDAQKKKVGNPDLSEMKMATAGKDRKDDASTKLCILSLCTKWQSWGECVPVINRELCLALARAGHRVACLVLTSSELDKEEARKGNVELIQCSSTPGINREDPQLLLHVQQVPFLPNLVIGHGQLTGAAAVHHAEKSSCREVIMPRSHHAEKSSCPRLHVIHGLPKEYIKYDEVANDQCNEEELARSAEFVAAIGTLLTEKWSALLNKEVFEIVPGLPDLTERNSIFSPQCRCFIPAKYRSPIASGLKIAVMAVNNSSQRESQPRRSTIIVRNTDSSSSKKPPKALKECDKNNVDLVERSGNNCQEAYFDIQGATVYLSPARVEAFGVAALDAMAIGIPIVISANSGLAYTIRNYFDEKFLRCIEDVSCGQEDQDNEEDGDIWSIKIDRISLYPKEAFDFADELRSEWKKKFSWDLTVQQLLDMLINSNLIPSASVICNEVTSTSAQAQCLNLVKELNFFDKRKKFILFLSPEDPELLKTACHLGLVHWAAVFDFDRESATKGYLYSCEPFLERSGKPACRMLPPLKQDKVAESQNVTFPNGIPWILLQGLHDMERDIDGNYSWIQEIMNHLKKKHPSTITLLVIWNSTSDKNLCKKLYKILTVMQTSWENSVDLKVLSTSDVLDSKLEEVADDWEVTIKKVHISDLCDAIYSTATAIPLNQLDPDFSLPKRSNASGEVTSATLPPSSRWVDSVVEVLYTAIGNTPEFGKDDALHFYKGGKISWYAIQMDYAVERESWKPLRNTIEEELEYPGTVFLTLFHQRGAGGTTSARKLLYDFHLRYPCVCLKTINYETFLAIKVIWEFCSLPVIILADINEASGAEDNDIDTLYGNLSNDKVSCLILHIVHRHYQADRKNKRHSSRKETVILAKPLTRVERTKFIEVYSLQSPTKRSELSKMKHEDEQLQIPFYYGLVAFEDRFQGLEPFVRDCLRGLDDAQRRALCFLTMAYQYGRKELPLSALAGCFRLKPRQLHDIEDVLSQDSIELLIEEDGRWRPRHCIIGEEMLRQLLTAPYGISRNNWNLNLADKTIEFVSYMEEDVTIAVLLNRISDEKTYKRFSSLVEDIPDGKDVVRVFEKAISVYPDNPFLKAHLGRYYSVREGSQKFHIALQYTDESILLASKMPSRNVRSQLTQMRGMIYKREVKNQIETAETNLDDIFCLAQEGVNAFTRAASINPDKLEDSYIPQVRMMCDIFKYIDRNFHGGIFEYLKSPDANPFILEGISQTSDILELVSDSSDYPYLRQDLFKLGVRGDANKTGNKEDLIKDFQELKKRSKTSIASINRQIVLLHLELCKEKQKPVSKIAKFLMGLLEEAMKYEQNREHTMRLWTKVAPHVPVDLMTAEDKIVSWCVNGKSVLAYLYRYIFTYIRIIEGGKDQRFEDERVIAEDELFKSVRATNRVALKHPDRPVVFLGNGKGLGQLVTLERDAFKEVRKQRTIPDTTGLRRLTGTIIKTGKVGQIRTDHGLNISFRADLCQPTLLVGESYLARKVCFYLAFTYFGTDAYNVRIIPG